MTTSYSDIYDTTIHEKFPLLHNKKLRFTHVTLFSQRLLQWDGHVKLQKLRNKYRSVMVKSLEK
jgi:hypothetical protein